MKIREFVVVENGSFPKPILPKGYIPPPDGSPPLKPVKHAAICTTPRSDGFYLMFCTESWEYVTYSFNDTIEYSKCAPEIEFGQTIRNWKKRKTDRDWS